MAAGSSKSIYTFIVKVGLPKASNNLKPEIMFFYCKIRVLITEHRNLSSSISLKLAPDMVNINT